MSGEAFVALGPASVAWPMTGGLASLLGDACSLVDLADDGPLPQPGGSRRKLGAQAPFAAIPRGAGRSGGVRTRLQARPASRLRAGRAEAARGFGKWPARVALWRRRLNYREGDSSQVCIDIANKVSGDVARTISDCVYRALAVHAAGPGCDPLRIVTRHDAAKLVYPPAGSLGMTPSPGIVMIQAPWHVDQPSAVRQSFYRTVVDMLHRRAGVGTQDVFVHLVDGRPRLQASEPRWINSIL